MCHVLIIEDEAIIAMVIEDTLIEAGATSVDLAATEEDAVACARAHPPAFITADINLKSGKGPEAVNRIRSELAACVPAVIITGNIMTAEPCSPPCPVLSKPFATAQLHAHFRALAPV